MSEKKSEKFYNVRLVNAKLGIDKNIDVSENEYILDVAEREGLELPYSCRTGTCINCTGRIIKGEVFHDYNFLKQKEIDAGFLLTCKASPLSDCEILTHQEDDLLDL